MRAHGQGERQAKHSVGTVTHAGTWAGGKTGKAYSGNTYTCGHMGRGTDRQSIQCEHLHMRAHGQGDRQAKHSVGTVTHAGTWAGGQTGKAYSRDSYTWWHMGKTYRQSIQ